MPALPPVTSAVCPARPADSTYHCLQTSGGRIRNRSRTCHVDPYPAALVLHSGFDCCSARRPSPTAPMWTAGTGVTKTAQTQCQSESYGSCLGEALAELQTRHVALKAASSPMPKMLRIASPAAPARGGHRSHPRRRHPAWLAGRHTAGGSGMNTVRTAWRCCLPLPA